MTSQPIRRISSPPATPAAIIAHPSLEPSNRSLKNRTISFIWSSVSFGDGTVLGGLGFHPAVWLVGGGPEAMGGGLLDILHHADDNAAIWHRFGKVLISLNVPASQRR